MNFVDFYGLAGTLHPSIMLSMRITGGRARGINLTTGKARAVRPATDRMREAVFSSIAQRVQGARFLDLFAGSGSYGLEALSRGAEGGLFVEKHPGAATALEQNLSAVAKSLGGLPSRSVSVVRRDVLRFSTHDAFSLVFMDPPYDLARSHGGLLLEKIRAILERTPESLLVYELPGDMNPPIDGWNCLRRIGKSGRNEPSALLLEPLAQ